MLKPCRAGEPIVPQPARRPPLAAAGALAGMIGALAVARAMRGMLYGVQPADLVTVAGVTLVVGLVGLGASARPAWKAAAVDPSTTLRAD